MDLKEWADINNYSPEEFIHELTVTMAAVGSMDMDNACTDVFHYFRGADELSFTITVERNVKKYDK